MAHTCVFNSERVDDLGDLKLKKYILVLGNFQYFCVAQRDTQVKKLLI